MSQPTRPLQLQSSSLAGGTLISAENSYFRVGTHMFSVAVNHLLRDYDYTPPGGQPTTVGSLWDKVDDLEI